jgi:putative Ca2+/H+ antiporter (TMEM165/GDT1 family)
MCILAKEKPIEIPAKDGFYESVFFSFSMIIFSEIGDKTFFVAVIMAMKHPRFVIFASAMLALVIMTVLSAVLGKIVPSLISPMYTKYLSSVLFVVFGLKMIKDGYQMSPSAGTEAVIRL